MSEKNISNGQIEPEKLEDYNVALYKRQESIDRQIVGGKLLLWSSEKEITFVQNPPRGERSKEIGRTPHARIVRLKSGHYSIRLRFAADERQIGYQLLAEIRNLNKMAQDDKCKQGLVKSKEEDVK